MVVVVLVAPLACLLAFVRHWKVYHFWPRRRRLSHLFRSIGTRGQLALPMAHTAIGRAHGRAAPLRGFRSGRLRGANKWLSRAALRAAGDFFAPRTPNSACNMGRAKASGLPLSVFPLMPVPLPILVGRKRSERASRVFSSVQSAFELV